VAADSPVAFSTRACYAGRFLKGFSAMTIIYRTAGPWGSGLGADLIASQVDSNFYNLDQRLGTVEASGRGAGIDYLQVSGSQFWVHLDNHQVLGPYTLPTATFNWTGPWQPNLHYNVNDLFSENGSIYMVLLAHTSPAVFDPAYIVPTETRAYALMLTQPALELPAPQTAGQVLTSTGNSPGDNVWATLTRNLALYIEGQPTANETVLQYVAPEEMTLPVGLTGSVAVAGTLPTAIASFTLYKNGSSIGIIQFQISPQEVVFSFPGNVIFNPGDILTVLAPASVDTTLANISFTIQALLP
jgi:hypothetical protein